MNIKLNTIFCILTDIREIFSLKNLLSILVKNYGILSKL